MEDKSVFSRLISDLTQSERLDMINKMRHIAPINDLPLKEEIIEEEYDHEKCYHNFSFFEKVYIFFTVLFSAREKEKVIEGLSMNKLSRELEKNRPDLINCNKKIFLNKFLLEIEKLEDSITIFKSTLSLIMRSGESEFIAFLVGLYFPEIEAKLLEQIGPKKISEEQEFENSFQLKRHIEFRVDEILSDITQLDMKILGIETFEKGSELIIDVHDKQQENLVKCFLGELIAIQLRLNNYLIEQKGNNAFLATFTREIEHYGGLEAWPGFEYQFIIEENEIFVVIDPKYRLNWTFNLREDLKNNRINEVKLRNQPINFFKGFKIENTDLNFSLCERISILVSV